MSTPKRYGASLSHAYQGKDRKPDVHVDTKPKPEPKKGK